MKTLAAWIKAHPGVNVLAFERNHAKSFGFGAWEEVCGFCLASHYFDGEPPKLCKYCRAPLRESHLISDLPELLNRVYRLGGTSTFSPDSPGRWPFIVWRNPRKRNGSGRNTICVSRREGGVSWAVGIELIRTLARIWSVTMLDPTDTDPGLPTRERPDAPVSQVPRARGSKAVLSCRSGS